LQEIIGINDGRVLRIPAFFSVKPLQVNGLVWFHMDTGSTHSAISESAATILGLDIVTLPYDKSGAVGFGGKFRYKIVNRPVEIVFNTSDKESYRVSQSGFKVVPAEHEDEAIRKELLARTPSVLGMDILNKFQIHITRKKVVFVPYDEKMGAACGDACSPLYSPK